MICVYSCNKSIWAGTIRGINSYDYIRARNLIKIE